MDNALKILEKNQLYRHIILFKLYVDSNGIALKNVTNIQEPIMELFGKKFENEAYYSNRKYLSKKGYIPPNNASHLTFEGIDYIEGFIKSFEQISDTEIKSLNKELPKPIFDFFKITSKSSDMISFINNIIDLSEKFN
jgi:hypothetical protein